MKEQLFDLPESLSPKLAWLRAHGLVTSYHSEYEEGGESPETGEEIYPWTCARYAPPQDRSISQGIIGVGRTEDDSIVDYCKRSALPHYSLKP